MIINEIILPKGGSIIKINTVPAISTSLWISFFAGGLLGTFLLRYELEDGIFLLSLVIVLTDARDPLVRALLIQSEMLYMERVMKISYQFGYENNHFIGTKWHFKRYEKNG